MVEFPGLSDGVVQDFAARIRRLIPTRKGVQRGRVGMSRYRLFLANTNDDAVCTWFEVDVREDRLIYR